MKQVTENTTKSQGDQENTSIRENSVLDWIRLKIDSCMKTMLCRWYTKLFLPIHIYITTWGGTVLTLLCTAKIFQWSVSVVNVVKPFLSVFILITIPEWIEPRHDKTNNVSVRPVKTQISLGICPIGLESSLSAWRNLGPLATHCVQAKTLIRLGRCPGWSESSLGAHSFCWFCHVVAQLKV